MSGNPLVEWDVEPELFQLGPVTVRWYGLLFALGFAIGFYLMRRMYRREEKPERDLETLLTYVVVGTVVGARLGHCLFYEPDRYLSNPIEILKIWKGGLASHGGAAGVAIALWLFARTRADQPFLWLCDRLAIPVALTSAFIRLGNLFNSEILGRPTDVSWAFVFKSRDHLSRHPAQLYESISYFAIFWVLWFLYRRKGALLPRGLNAGLVLFLIFSARFCIEFVKERQASYGSESALTVGQWLSLPVIAIGLFLIVRAKAPTDAKTSNSTA